MPQRSLHEFLARPLALSPRIESGAVEDNSPLQFVDLFSGMGGASQGAVEAGCKVVLAVDSWGAALRIHKLNHGKGTVHMCSKLPSKLKIPFPERGQRWHLHGSPPCQTVSTAQYAQEPEEQDIATAIGLIEWYIEFAINSGATTFSMEQVSTPPVRKALEALRLRHRSKLDYEVLDFARIGVPQHRRRLIAGSPHLIAKLRRLDKVTRGVRDVVSNPRGTHVRGHTCWGTIKRARNGKKLAEGSADDQPNGSGRLAKDNKYVYKHYGMDDLCIPIDQPSVCVLASKSIRWANPGTGQKPTCMNPRELAAIQTFPADYKLDDTAARCNVQIGNALPPLVMRRLLEGEPGTRRVAPLADAPPLSPSLDPEVLRDFRNIFSL